MLPTAPSEPDAPVFPVPPGLPAFPVGPTCPDDAVDECPADRRPRAAAPVGSMTSPPAAPAAAKPPPPLEVAATSGVTNRIKAGIANKATSISISPVRTEITPVPSSWNTSVPTNLKAVAYTIAAAGL